MDLAAAAVRERVDVPILTQRDLPKPALVARFAADESTCIFATAGFFQGVDVPGRTLSLVVIDRLPFPRPDDPLLSARREAARTDGVRRDRHPRAAMLLAQALGPADPQRHRPRRRRRARPPPRHGPLPLGHRQGAAPDAPHPRPCRGRSVPRRAHRRLTRVRSAEAGAIRSAMTRRARPRRRRRRGRHDHPGLPRQPQRACRSGWSRDLNAALDVAEAGIGDGSVRVVVVTHVPPAFCAGADLKERRIGAAGLGTDGRCDAAG